MSNIWSRQGAEYVNQMNRGLGALLGIATGMLCDKQLADAEVRFLQDWLDNNSAGNRGQSSISSLRRGGQREHVLCPLFSLPADKKMKARKKKGASA